MIQQTSLSAFSSIKHQITNRQSLVLAALVNDPLTNLEISHKLRLPINSITPRVLELRKVGIITEDSIVMQSTGRNAIKWRLI